MKRWRKGACAVCVATVTVTGCTTWNLDPAAPMLARREGEQGAGTLSWLVEQAGWLQADYANRYRSQAQFQTLLDLPIIGLAIATAGNILLGGSTTTSAILGTSAGGLTALQVYWNANAQQAAYAGGAAKAGCIFVNGQLLRTYVTDEGMIRDNQGGNELVGAAEALDAVRMAVLASGLLNAPATETDPLAAAARAALRSAFDASSQALEVVRKQRAAARRSAGIVQAALDRTQVAVIEATRRQPASFATVQSSVIDVLNTAGANQEAILAARRALAGRASPPEEEEGAGTRELIAPRDPIGEMNRLTANLTLAAAAVLDAAERVDITRLNESVALCAPTA